MSYADPRARRPDRREAPGRKPDADKLIRCECGGALRLIAAGQYINLAGCELCGKRLQVSYRDAAHCICDRLFVPQDYDDRACDIACARNIPMREQRRRWLRNGISNPALLPVGGER